MFCSFCSTLFPWVAVPARNLLQLPSRCIHLLHSGVFHGLQGLPASLWCSPQAENEFLLHCVLRGLHRLLAPAAPSPLLMWLTFVSAGLFGFFFPHFSHFSASYLLCCTVTLFQIRYHTGTTSFIHGFSFWLEAGLTWNWLEMAFYSTGTAPRLQLALDM